MKQYTFNWEVQTLLEQFTAAFNDIVIKTYDKDKVVSDENIKVKFVYAPKQRVLATLTNPAPGGLSVPLISINQTSITRDQSRVFNKLDGFNVPHSSDENLKSSFLRKIPQPVPVDIGVSMTILTKFQADMDQIISNFVPYCDPYVIISSKLPGLDDSNIQFEMRTKVIWGGTITYNLPIDIGPNQPYRISADTNFVIKGWLFKRIHEDLPRVFQIDTDFSAASNAMLDYSLLDNISGSSNTLSKGIAVQRYKNMSTIPGSILEETSDSENGFTQTTLARPVIKFSSPEKLSFFSNDILNLLPNLNIDLHGEYFIQSKMVFVSGSETTMFDNVSTFNLFDFDPVLNSKYPAFSGIPVPRFYILNDQHISFNLPAIPKTSGRVDVIVVNDAGYSILSSSNSKQVSGINIQIV